MLSLNLIKEKISKLQKEVENISNSTQEEQTYQNNLVKAMAIKQDLLADTNNLIKYIPSDILDLFDNSEIKDKEKLAGEIEIIRGVINGIVNLSLPMKLTVKQKKSIKDIINYLDNKIVALNKKIDEIKVSTLNKKRQLDSEIKKLSELEEVLKVGSFPLSEEEFQILYGIINDKKVSNRTKIVCLKELVEYNKGQYVVSESSSEIDEKILVKKFRECGYENIETIKDKCLEFEDEIKSFGDIFKITDILSYFNELNILNRFDAVDILSICMYGNLEFIKNMYEIFLNEENLCNFVFKNPSVWVEDKIKTPDLNNDTLKKLSSIAHRISYEEAKKNEQFLQVIGFDAAISSEKSHGILLQPNYKLVERYQKLVEYGIIDPGERLTVQSAFMTDKVIDKCDKLIEIGLLHPISGDDSDKNYVKNNSSFVSVSSDERIAYLSGLKSKLTEEEFYLRIFSKRRVGFLDPLMSGGSRDKNFVGKTLDKIIAENGFVDIVNQSSSFSKYAEVIAKNKDNYFSVYCDSEIADMLDSRYGISGNEYVYLFGDQIISRKKVLNNLAILEENSISIDKEALLYAISRGSYLTADRFEFIKKDIDNLLSKGDENYGLSQTL